MLNKVILIGRLTRDPELRYTPNGVAVCRFNLAVVRNFANAQGERATDFIDIVVWRKLAEVIANNIKKGRLVAIEGSLQIRSYDDRDGIRRKASEILAETVKFLDWPKDGQGKESSNEGEVEFGSEVSFSDEDVPF